MKETEKEKTAEKEAEKETETPQTKETEAENAEGTADTAKKDPDSAADKADKEAAALKKQLAEEKDRYLRLAAEYDNFRKRSSKEREAAYTDAYAEALRQIIPVVDNLERAAGFASDGAQADAKQLSDGVQMILSQFADVLKKLGIEPFGEAGENFDPQLHNAIMHEDNPELGENVITDVFQKGYRRGDRIIRFAMVKVAN